MIHAEEQVTEVITEVAEQIGFSDVKAKQREAILAFLSGKDTFVSLPTGYGKSLIFALLPRVFNRIKGKLIKYVPIIYASDSITGCNDSVIICISPLTSLVMDQREKLRYRGINAEYVGEQRKDWAVVKKVLNADVEIVFISPESILCNKTF